MKMFSKEGIEMMEVKSIQQDGDNLVMKGKVMGSTSTVILIKPEDCWQAVKLLGHGINYVTGDYSRGAAGYWIEDGKIAYPVEEITIAGNLKAMLAGIVAVGNDVQIRGSKITGSIMLDRMTVAGE